MNEQKFSFDQVQDFDTHISKSISGYSNMIDSVKSLSSYFARKGSTIVDVGASSGKLVDELQEAHEHCQVIGIDSCAPIIQSKRVINTSVENFDFPPNTNLVLSLFTLQFIVRETRQKILEKIYESLNEGGGFIVAEKCIMQDGQMNDMFTFSNYDFKSRHFQPQEILSKERDLRSIMHPLTEHQNMEMIKKAGFNKMQKFFQSLQYNAWLAIK